MTSTKVPSSDISMMSFMILSLYSPFYFYSLASAGPSHLNAGTVRNFLDRNREKLLAHNYTRNKNLDPVHILQEDATTAQSTIIQETKQQLEWTDKHDESVIHATMFQRQNLICLMNDVFFFFLY